jgi:hypothetical protein
MNAAPSTWQAGRRPTRLPDGRNGLRNTLTRPVAEHGWAAGAGNLDEVLSERRTSRIPSVLLELLQTAPESSKLH